MSTLSPFLRAIALEVTSGAIASAAVAAITTAAITAVFVFIRHRIQTYST
jgi:hypothetical protein